MNKRQKICFVVPRVYSLLDPKITNQIGGSEKQLYMVARALAKVPEYEIHFLVADFGQEELIHQDNISYWRSFSFRQSKFRGGFKLYQTLKKINADIYVFRAPDLGVFIGLFMVKHILRKKTVYMLASHVEIFHQQLKNVTGMLDALSMKYVYRMAHRITAQNANQQQLFEENRGRKVDVLIPNLVEDFEMPAGNQVRDVILWVGRCIPLKRPELFMIIAKSYPDERFMMICPPSEDEYYFQQIKHQAESIPNLEFVEYIAPSEMNEIYLRSKLYLLTSEAEGFSNTMTEAMSSGCPVVSLSVNPDGIFDKHKAGLFSHNKIAEFEKNIDQLLKNPAKGIELAQNAMEYLVQHHDEDVVTAKFRELIDSFKQ